MIESYAIAHSLDCASTALLNRWSVARMAAVATHVVHAVTF